MLPSLPATLSLPVGWAIIVGVVALLFMGWDKQTARRAGRRIPEKTLWILAISGGAWGVFLAMHIFRHKTRHASFRFGIPLLVLLHGIIAVHQGWL